MTMLIDWFTVGAQVLNFVVLVWLMKRFLYKPVLKAVEAREKRIETELADAAAKKAESQKERDDFQQKNVAFDAQRAALLQKAVDAAKAEGQRLLVEARTTADALGAKQKEAFRSDAESLNQVLRRRTQTEVFAIARKALADLAGVGLEERAAEVFVQRLRALDAPTRATLAKALKTGPDPALLRSAFELPPEQQTKIKDAVSEVLAAASAPVALRFEVAPDLVGGLELSANGQKLAWSMASFLGALEKGVRSILQEKSDPANLTGKTKVPAHAE
jgi:F-type H+-transporting ATPase subunit b